MDMNKRIKFYDHLVKPMLSGNKTATWRLFDDKNFQAGDVVDCINTQTGEQFAVIEITDVYEKPLGQLTDNDWVGHERFASDEAMYAAYREYYPGQPVGPDTLVKIIHFNVLK